MNFEPPLEQAVRAFWAPRAHAAAKQAATAAEGRGAVAAGDDLATLEDIVVAEFVAAGFDRKSVRRGAGIDLPGYDRPDKKWDIVVIEDDHLIAAIEFNFQVGPSSDSTFDNRIEEAPGRALDVWRAYGEGVFGLMRPWLGYFVLLEAAGRSSMPVSLPATSSSIEPGFRPTSHQDRYQILCRRLLRERLYDAVCFLTASVDSPVVISEPDAELSVVSIVAKIAGSAARIRSARARCQQRP